MDAPVSDQAPAPAPAPAPAADDPAPTPLPPPSMDAPASHQAPAPAADDPAADDPAPTPPPAPTTPDSESTADLGPTAAPAPDLGPTPPSSPSPATAPDLGPTPSDDPAPDSGPTANSSPSPDPGTIAAPDEGSTATSASARNVGPTPDPATASDEGLTVHDPATASDEGPTVHDPATASDEGPTVHDPIKEEASSPKIAYPHCPPQPSMDLPVSDPGTSVERAAASAPAPAADLEPTPDPTPAPDPGPTPELPCPHSDSELVRKLAQLLLPGLATAAVDSTTGDPFRSPATVAVDLRRDLVDHLTAQSLTFIPQSLALLGADPNLAADLPDLDDPLDVLSHLVEDFAASRRNLLGRVSGWILSDSREDKIDDFVQEMDLNNFWKLDRREIVADDLLKNLDYKNKYHCSMRFNTEEELEDHKKDCSFRPVGCKNDGCKVKYCRVHEEQHDEVCPYKILECEQKCGEKTVRREMDRHCITVCRMKMMNCPFYAMGCHSAFPQCQLREHCEEFVRTHVACVMGVKNEEGLGVEVLKARAENMEQSPFRNELASALDVRRLTLAIKNVEAKMKKQQEQGQ